MIRRDALPRRTFLRGVGVALGLPFLDAMVPVFAAAKTSPAPPLRMAFVYVPNGIDMVNWNPTYKGPLGELPKILQPLEPVKDDILLLSNLTHNAGRALLDGPGDHGRCSGSYLTGVHVKKSTTDIHSGISCDQHVANHVGGSTQFPSMEIGMEDARQAGSCDSGYSCAYTNNLSWKSENQALPPILDPRMLFERLFGADAALSPEARARQNVLRSSIMDFVQDDTHQLERNLGPSDRRKLDEYLSAVRSIELRIQKSANEQVRVDPGMEMPFGIPAEFSEHFRLMTDMMTVAFQADLTRVMTFVMTREGTSRPYRELGIADGHHPLSHHRGNAETIAKITKINTYHVAQFSSWLQKLKSIREGDGSMLDNCMIVYGAGLSDGNQHLHEDLPTLIAGRGGNTIKTGRRVVYRRETPMCNLHLSLMARMGVPMDHFGDSTGKLEGLDLT